MADEERPTEERPTVRARRLGAELRRLREAAGCTTEDAAKALKCSRAKISRIETGSNGIRALDLGILLGMYGLEEQERREALEKLSRESRQRGWWYDYGDAISAAYSDFIGLESDAVHIRAWENAVIPGLLQIPDYVRALAEASLGTIDPEREKQLIEIRVERQNRLSGEQAPRYCAIVWEPVLRSPVGGSKVQVAQLDWLLKTAEQPNVTLQVIPLSVGAHAGNRGAFSMFSFPDSPEAGAVFIESLTSSHYLDRQVQLNAYTLVFDQLRSTALSPADSLDLISEIKKDI